MPEQFLRSAELAFGPDVLRWGSKNARLGRGEWAWIATRHPDPTGGRFFRYPASRGHETFICEANILLAMFGDELPRVTEELMFAHDEYEQFGVEYRPTGRRTRSWDWVELRRRAEADNLFGRAGSIRGRAVLMLWSQPEGWLDLLKIAVSGLNVTPDTILTAGRIELGVVKDFIGGAA